VTLDLGTGSGNLFNRSGIAAASFGALQGGASTVLKGASNHNTTTTYSVGAKDLSTVFAGSIQNGTGGAAALTALVKTGSGTLTLSGTNTHSGATTVNGGTLLVTGSVGTSAVTVAEGGTLSGTGSIAAATIQGDATLSPGDSGPGVLTFTNGLTLAAESVTRIDLGTTRDRIDVTGNLTLNGIINFTNAGGLLPGTYTIFNYTGTLVGSGLAVGSVPADFGCTIDTATAGQVKVVVTSTLSAFQQWQILWFGSQNNPNAAPGEDPDLDGQTNNDEFLAGTDPTSAASVATLYWRGDGAGNLWDVQTSATFWNSNRLSTFTNGNPVVFDASGSANPTVNLSGSLSPVSVSVNSTATMTFTGSGKLAGAATLTKTGTGTLNLQTANSHTGLTSVNGGIVNLSGNQAGATGGYALNIVNSSTSTLNLGSASQTAATTVVTGVFKSIQLGAIPGVNTATSTSAQTVNVNGAAGFPTTVTNSGSLAVARNATLNLGSHSSWNQGGTVNVQANGGYGANLNIGTAAGSNAAMTYTGTSPILLSQTAGTSSVSTLTIRSGILTTGQPVHFNGASGNANGYGRMILTNGGTLKLSAPIPQLVTGDASGRFILSNLGGGIIDTNGFNTTIDRVLVDSNPVSFIGSLAKTGAGKLILSNNNTYSGITSVTGGTLMVTGSIATSTTTVSSSGILAGTGTIGGLTISSGGTLAPGGENPGTLATGPLALEPGSSAIFRLGSTGDRVDVSGSLALGGTITIIDTGSAVSGSYTLFTHTGTLSGTASLVPPPGFTASLDSSTPGIVKVTLNSNLYATWSRDHFTPTELGDPAISGPNASPANDGLTNLLKYALGLPPKTLSSTGITIAAQAGTHYLIYQRPASRPDLYYTVEASTNLALPSWSDSGVVHEPLTTGDPETWLAGVPGDTGRSLFLRLNVSLK
jgi:autotransporter-associated beta strand protein